MFACDHVVNRALFCRGQIEEEEVEVKPENLLPFKVLFRNSALLKECKSYFTDDGWLVVKSGIESVQNIVPKG